MQNPALIQMTDINGGTWIWNSSCQMIGIPKQTLLNQCLEAVRDSVQMRESFNYNDYYYRCTYDKYHRCPVGTENWDIISAEEFRSVQQEWYKNEVAEMKLKILNEFKDIPDTATKIHVTSGDTKLKFWTILKG